MVIHDKTGKTLLDIPVDDDSYRHRAIAQAKSLELHYSLPGHVELPTGAYVDFQGERYTLWYPSGFRKLGTRNLEYRVTFGGDEEILKKYRYKLLSAKPYKLKFPLTATPRMFVQLLVDNLNLHDTGWTVGTVIEGVERPMGFNHESCWAVLGRLTQEFETEFEIVGKAIHLRKVEYFKDSPVALSYGKGNGFVPGVGRSNQGDNLPVEILYVQGGDRNIDYSTYGSPTLLLPKSQELEYEGRRYKTDADGMYVTRADRELASRNEDSYDAGHVHPSRVGTVSAADTEPGKDTEGNPVTFHNFYDSSVPASLDFGECLIAGQSMTVIFQSGRLAGREFDVRYAHEGRKFEIVSCEQDGMTLPNGSLYPSVGDTYAVFNISLPAAYVCDNATRTGASWDMFREAVRYLREHEERKFTFRGELDGIWARRNWLAIGGKLVPGGYVDFSDTQFQEEGVLIRIVGIRDHVNRPHAPELELSNTPVAGFLSDDLGKLEAEEVTTDKKHKEALAHTLRRWRDAIDMQNMMGKAFKDYGKGQTMAWLRTMSVLIGHESLQYRFVDRIPTAEGAAADEVDHAFTYTGAERRLATPAGTIQHMTLGIETLAPSHKPTEYRYWNIAAYESPYLDDTESMFLYIRCGKSTNTGTFLLSKEPHEMDGGDSYYFLAGALGSESEGERSFATLYGFSEIGPGWMRLNKIISTDGTQYWDMLSRAFSIGDANRGISYDQANGLVLRGCVYQSPSGAVDYPEVDRGDYASGIPYYPGDRVAWDGSIYKCLAPTDGSINPSSQAHWKRIVSRGEDGKPGEPGRPGYDGSDGQDGKDGKDGIGIQGPVGPRAPFRGKYSQTASYCGTPQRTDVVKGADGHYYVARTDNGGSFNAPPPNAGYWEPFGAEFSSVATDLLLSRRITAGEIETRGLTAQYIATGYDGPRVETEGSMMTVYGDFATPNIRFGVDANGASTLAYYDNEGNFMYDLGPEGIRYLRQPSMQPARFAYIYPYTSGLPTFGDLENTITLNLEGVSYYRYDMGNAGVTSAMRAAHGKIYQTSGIDPSTRLPSGTPIPNGWYTAQIGEAPKYSTESSPPYTSPPSGDGIQDPMISTSYPTYGRRIQRFSSGASNSVQNVYWVNWERPVSQYSMLADADTLMMASPTEPLVYSRAADGKTIYQLTTTTSATDRYLAVAGPDGIAYKMAASYFKGEKGDPGTPGTKGDKGDTGPAWNGGTIYSNMTIVPGGIAGMVLQGTGGSGEFASSFINMYNGSSYWQVRSSGNGDLSISKNTLNANGRVFYISGANAGNMWIMGALVQNSDMRFKNRSSTVENVLDKVRQLDVFHYTLKSDDTNSPRIGVSAQAVKEVFPELVQLEGYNEDIGDHTYSVDYINLATLVAINGVKELLEMVEGMRKEIDELKGK